MTTEPLFLICHNLPAPTRKGRVPQIRFRGFFFLEAVMKKVLIVGGTFGETHSRSYFVDEIRSVFLNNGFLCTCYNGGELKTISYALDDVKTNDIIVWMPNIDNSIEKYLPQIKKINSKCILVRSKRNDNKKYSDYQLVKRMFSVRTNYCLEISKDDGYSFRVLDPLGNCWFKGSSINEAAKTISFIIFNVSHMNRFPSVCCGEKIPFEIDKEFIEVVKTTGGVFTEMVRGVINKDRFLGNASTRCMRGFPGVRSNGRVFMSKRNVQKETICEDDFVEVSVVDGHVNYYGNNKPSVDSAVQCMLFEYFSNINFIIHGHVYVEGGMFTQSHVPCGYIEEFNEILELGISRKTRLAKINLKGHGCIVMASDIKAFSEVNYESRQLFEINFW